MQQFNFLQVKGAKDTSIFFSCFGLPPFVSRCCNPHFSHLLHMDHGKAFLFFLVSYIRHFSVSERCAILMHFLSWSNLEGKSCGPKNEQRLGERTDWKAKSWNNESSKLPASFRLLETSWVVWFPQKSPRNTIYFFSSRECPGCFALSHSSLVYLTHLHMSKFSNGGGDATFTSTEPRWAAKKWSLAPTSGARTPCLQSSGPTIHPKSFRELYDS